MAKTKLPGCTFSNPLVRPEYTKKNAVIQDLGACRPEIPSSKPVRHKAAGIGRDAPAFFANAEPGGFVVHHPQAEHGMLAVKVAGRCDGLIDKAFFTIVSRRLVQNSATGHHLHVRALTAQLGLLHVTSSQRH